MGGQTGSSKGPQGVCSARPNCHNRGGKGGERDSLKDCKRSRSLCDVAGGG